MQAAIELSYLPSTLRQIVCSVLREIPNKYNWTERPNVWEEVQELAQGCEWFKVYDIIEAVHAHLLEADSDFGTHHAAAYAASMNSFFVEKGIGWQIVNGTVVIRADEGFQQAVKMAASDLQESERPTAAGHILSAIRALSERPKANTAGAVSHATSSVECLLHDITGEAMTLGKYLDKHPTLFHPALKKALDGVYGYASDAGARHGKEGKEPNFDEAQFAVTTCAAACTLLTKSNPEGKL